MIPDTITINHPTRGKMQVETKDYVKRKTAQLREFGYPDLTEEDVSAEIGKLLDGGGGLTVIGHFMDGEVVR